jgi:hypothetical protein
VLDSKLSVSENLHRLGGDPRFTYPDTDEGRAKVGIVLQSRAYRGRVDLRKKERPRALPPSCLGTCSCSASIAVNEVV